MDRKLIKYLPEYLREYTEEKALLEAMEPELRNIWNLSGEMLKEAFILSHGTYGAGRWEDILGIHPKDTDSLETRNLRILAKINEELPYTMLTLERFFKLAVGEEGYELELAEEEYLLDIQIRLKYLAKMQEIRDYIEQVVPVNLILLYTGKQTDSYPVGIQTESCFTARADFYPRYNREYLCLDASWFLDGSYSLSGYKSDSQTDFYPSSMCITMSAGAELGTDGMLTVERDLWKLDGAYGLDGSKLLDAEILKYRL